MPPGNATSIRFCFRCAHSIASAYHHSFAASFFQLRSTVLAELGEKRITFLNHSVINYVATQDVEFNIHMHDAIQNLIKKSTQLSGVGEKERTRFFSQIRNKIKQAGRF